MKAWKTMMILLIWVMTCTSISIPALAETAQADLSSLYKDRDVDSSWTNEDAAVIDLSTLRDSVLTITKKGDYVLSGTWNGQVVIEAPEDDKVRLILNGVTITCPEGPAIYEKQSDKLIITLAEGTQNTLTDGAAITDGEDSIGAALYAEDDLSINGSGVLVAHGTSKHGIQSKADLIIAGGQIFVDAVTDAIRGRNSVLVLNGMISIVSQGDGIVSTREDKEGKGWIIIAGGMLTIQTGSGAGEQTTLSMQGNRGSWGRNIPVSPTSTLSQKAVKAATDLTVLDGTLTFDCADDGLHAVNVTVSGGTFLIRSGDDGMHADNEMIVNDGIIDIAQCYEGIEGKNVTINGGDIRIVASDDGVNAAGGNDASGFGGRGGDRFSGGDSGNMLVINGGALSVTAGNDGLDSNGSIQMNGGNIGIWTATTQGDGAIDFNASGTITGGTLIIVSTNGVMRDTASMTGQAAMTISVSTQTAGTEIKLLDSNGNILGSFTPESAYDTIVVSSDCLQEGAFCTILCGDMQVYSGAMSNNLSSSGTSNGFGGGTKNNRRGW
ncbi:MAG: carbohydrate-binding domain-containing protein [Clostridia bacterium]|nr:carbohydrate-binding domain-containing protein [Clostridia bacterium]